MDSRLAKDKTDSPATADPYNESMDWIRSMNAQMKSPGAFISSRLESVSLDQIHREFSSLLLTSQSHGSSLLRTAFTNANAYNDNLKKIIMSLWPIKDKVSDSYNYLKTLRDDSLRISEAASTLTGRLEVVLHTRLAISTILEANDHFENLCAEVVDTFSPLHPDKLGSNHYSKLSHVLSLVDLISKRAYRMNTLIQNLSPDYNLESSWVLLEFAPKELSRISALIERFKQYDKKIGQMLNAIPAATPNQHSPSHGRVDGVDGAEGSGACNVNRVILMECGLDSVRSERLSEFSLSKFENDTRNLVKSLNTLIEVCANIAFTKLHRLYTDLNNLNLGDILTNDNEGDVITEEINRLLAGLVSIVRGHNQLKEEGSQLLVGIFNETFLQPFLESSNLLVSSASSSRSFLSLQEESNAFPRFVDSVENAILSRSNILMRFLNDLSQLMGDESFKSECVLGPVARSILNFVDETYSAIFSPIYPDLYSLNYNAFDRLLTLLETYADGSLKNYLKWRGTPLPNSFATRFCTGVICDNFVEKVRSEVDRELERHQQLDGNYRKVGSKKFYTSASCVVYNQACHLFSEKELFHHLFPQYLKGLEDVMRAYVNHVEGFITHMESANKSEDATNLRWPTGLSFAYSTYVLHDVLEFSDSLACSDLGHARFEAGKVLLNGNFGTISQILLRVTQKHLETYVKHLSSVGDTGHYLEKAASLWVACLDLYLGRGTPAESPPDLEGLGDLRNIFNFTIKAMHLVCNFIANLQDHVNFVEDKLEQYIVSSLYNSSKCSLQFIQSLSSKYRTSNKNESFQVSDYVKFLVAPMLSFNEFTQDILSKETLKTLMLKTIQLVAADYINHISNLLKSVENLNSSLMNPKNISLSESSESFLIVDMAMLRRQISRDVSEFYQVCVTNFGVDRRECGSLDTLMEYNDPDPQTQPK